MKHRILALLLVCALMFSLTACVKKTAEVSVRVDAPVIGQAVSEYLDSCVGVTVNGTALTRADSTDDTYGGGTQFTAEIWSGYEVGWDDMPYDTFIATQPKYGDMMYYAVRIRYAVSAEYEKAEYTFDTVGVAKYTDETSDTLSADGNWRIYDNLVSFRPTDGIGMTQTSISVPAPEFGKSVAELNAEISVSVALTAEGYDYFSKESTVLTYTDSTDYNNPDIYENGTKFTVQWMGPNGGVDSIGEYDNGHVFSEEDRDEAGNHFYATITYATPAAYPVNYAVSDETIWYQPEPVQTDEWIIRTAIVVFPFPEKALPQVYISAPTISIGETVAEANAGIVVEVDGVPFTLNNETAIDPDSEFIAMWICNNDSTDAKTMSDGDVFTGEEGTVYTLWIDFLTPYEPDMDFDHSFDYSIDTGNTEAFNATGIGASSWMTNGAETHCFNRARIDYVLHEHTFGDWTLVTPASCTAAGEQTRTCTECGYTETETLAAMGHNWSDWTITVKPTCTSEGAHYRTCSRCGAQQAEKLAALGHSYTYTRTVGNHHSAVCSRCGDTFTADCVSKDGYCIYCGEIVIIY